MRMSHIEDLCKRWTQGKCYLCGDDLGNKGKGPRDKSRRLYYLMGGAVADEEHPIMDLVRKAPASLRGFLHLGSHGRNSDFDVDVCVVDHLPWGQFDVQFCSFKCFREWWLAALALVESTADREE